VAFDEVVRESRSRVVRVEVRPAGPDEVDAVVEVVTTAFQHDPLWSWAFPDEARRPEQYRKWWRHFVEPAASRGFVSVTAQCESAAVWIPPGEDELSPEETAQEPALVEELLGARAPVVVEMLRRFEAAHPHDEPHYYLSIVATHRDHRGHGLGVALLADKLAQIDAERMPAYLESSNPANVARYELLGFVPRGEFAVRDDGPLVTKMWRDAR
jgi:ribosomal protein S18 acetylase RimI-like enzyme